SSGSLAGNDLEIASVEGQFSVPESLRLNGGTSYAEVLDKPWLNVTADWTVEAWFKDENPNGYNHPRQRILTKGDTAGPEVPYFLGVESGGLFAGIRAKSAAQVVRYDLQANKVSANAWHHVAATLERATKQLILYLDGVEVARAPVTGFSVGNTLPLDIGRSGAGSFDTWKGKIDDVRILALVRTADEI